MTRRKSERELEQALDDLGGDADTVREWADQYFERQIAEHGFDLVWSAEDSGGRIPIRESRDGFTYYAPPEDIPAWIDREDLPVRP